MRAPPPPAHPSPLIGHAHHILAPPLTDTPPSRRELSTQPGPPNAGAAPPPLNAPPLTASPTAPGPTPLGPGPASEHPGPPNLSGQPAPHGCASPPELDQARPALAIPAAWPARPQVSGSGLGPEAWSAAWVLARRLAAARSPVCAPPAAPLNR